MVTGATVPCCDSATALSPVMRARGGGVDDKDDRLAVTLGDIHRCAHGAQIVRAGPRRHDDKVGIGHHAGNRLCDGWRSIDYRDLDAHAVQPRQRAFQVGQARLDEVRRGRLARVPPMSKAALRIGVDQRDLAGAGAGCFHGQVAGQGGLARPAFLGCSDDGVHAVAPTVRDQHAPAAVAQD